jgi:Ca-activated chloride channel family protein
MLEFAWPWAVTAAPLPWIVRKLWPAEQGFEGAAVRVPFYGAAASWSKLRQASSASSRALALLLVWCLVLSAACRPQWVDAPSHVPVTGRDLVLALDLSGSMGTKDWLLEGQNVDRLHAVKEIAGDFLERRLGDRVALVVFGTEAFLQVPLTFDLKMARALMKEAVVGLAGTETAIGDAIGLAVDMLRDRPASTRVLILLTDGENTTGNLDLDQATRLAALHDVRIHTITIENAERRATKEQQDLRAIAQAGGGSHFEVESVEALEAVYEVLDALEPAADSEDVFRPRTELFHWPLALAYAVLVVWLLRHLIEGLRAGPTLRPRVESTHPGKG